MKTIIFARRNLKEMLNDILSLFFYDCVTSIFISPDGNIK